jgi:WD40 repeat protein
MILQQMDFAKPIRSLSFSHSNNYLALGGDEGLLFVLSVPNRSVILNMAYDSPIQSIAFSRHDERLSVGLSDGVLSLLCPSDDWKSCGEIDYSDSTILCQDWSSNYLSIGRQDGSVAVFDKEKAFDEFFVPVAEFSAESAPIRSVAFGAGGRNLGKSKDRLGILLHIRFLRYG